MPQAASEVPTGVANEYGYVLVAVDMWGTSNEDGPTLVRVFFNISTVVTVPDRLHQGILNSLMAMKVMRGAFASDAVALGTIDVTRAYYWGISMGGIAVRDGPRRRCLGRRIAHRRPTWGAPKRSLPAPSPSLSVPTRPQGTVVMAVSQDVQRGHLGVAGVHASAQQAGARDGPTQLNTVARPRTRAACCACAQEGR